MEPQKTKKSEQGQVSTLDLSESMRVEGQNKTKRRTFLKTVAATGLCGLSPALKEATAEVKEEVGSGEDSFANKALRVFSVLNEEEIESIKEAGKEPDRFLLSPKLKGKAVLALWLLFTIYEENKAVAAVAGKGVSA